MAQKIFYAYTLFLECPKKLGQSNISSRVWSKYNAKYINRSQCVQIVPWDEVKQKFSEFFLTGESTKNKSRF